MPWHDATPWKRKHDKAAKNQTALAKLERIERQVRAGEMSILDAVKFAYLMGCIDDGPKPRITTPQEN
jgi:hypothetical protein